MKCDCPGLVQNHVEPCQLLAQASLYRHHQPVLPRVGIDQDHDIVGKTCVLDARVLAVSRHHLGTLQHAVHLCEVNVAEHGGDHVTLSNTALARRLQDQLQDSKHLRITDPFGHLRQQHVVPDVVEVALQVQIQDARLVPDDRLGDALNRLMSTASGTVAKRPVLEVGLEDWLHNELQGSLHHAVPDRPNRQQALAASIRFRDGLATVPRGLIRAIDQFVAYLLKERLDTRRLDGLERHSVGTRSAVVGLRSAVGFTKRFPLADMHEEAPEAPRRFKLRLGV